MFRIYLSLLVRKEVISPSREAYLLCLLLHSLKTENLRSPFCQSRHAIHAFSGYIERSTPMSLAENSQNVSEDQILQRFGYRQEYKRELRRFASFAIGFSFISLIVDVVAVDYAVAATVLPSLFNYAETNQNAWLVTGIVIIIQMMLIIFSTLWSTRINSAAVGTEIIGIVGLTLLLVIVGA